MKNVIILGSGRSGTSMLAGTLSKSGYFMGKDLYPPRNSNPKGFFECPEINNINEQIISKSGTLDSKKIFSRYNPQDGQRWLSRMKIGTKLTTSSEILDRIMTATSYTPYCYKDPRFCYTLPAWKPYLNNTIYLCVFRDPYSTVKSIIKECEESITLKGMYINEKIALDVWKLMYKHIFFHIKQEEQWLFIHYNQILLQDGLLNIKNLIGANVDTTFPDKNLRRSYSFKMLKNEESEIYSKLCELANYDDH